MANQLQLPTINLPITNTRSIIEAATLKMIENRDSFVDVPSPIYIPSRGRHDTLTITKPLDESELEYLVVVEPQDAETYAETIGAEKILTLPANNRGIAYARNFIREHAKRNGHERCWQFDDNIRAFKVREDGKVKRIDARKAIAIVDALADEVENFGGAAINHAAFAFSYDKRTPVSTNRQIYSAMLMTTTTRHEFRDGVPEDTDFSLQLLRDGYNTFVFRRLCVEKATTMTMKGGNTDTAYAGDGRLARYRKLQEYWPGAFRIVDTPTRKTIAPSRIWSTFDHDPILKDGDKLAAYASR